MFLVFYNLVKHLIDLFNRHILVFLNYFNRVIDMHRLHTRKKIWNTRFLIGLDPLVPVNESWKKLVISLIFHMGEDIFRDCITRTTSKTTERDIHDIGTIIQCINRFYRCILEIVMCMEPNGSLEILPHIIENRTHFVYTKIPVRIREVEVLDWSIVNHFTCFLNLSITQLIDTTNVDAHFITEFLQLFTHINCLVNEFSIEFGIVFVFAMICNQYPHHRNQGLGFGYEIVNRKSSHLSHDSQFTLRYDDVTKGFIHQRLGCIKPRTIRMLFSPKTQFTILDTTRFHGIVALTSMFLCKVPIIHVPTISHR